MTSPRRRLLAAALLATALTGCGGDEPGTAAEAQDPDPANTSFELAIEDGLDVVPEVLTVPPGSTVDVVNRSSQAHGLTADPGAPAAFDTGAIPQGDTAQLRLDVPGRYPYSFRLEPALPAGVLVVEQE